VETNALGFLTARETRVAERKFWTRVRSWFMEVTPWKLSLSYFILCTYLILKQRIKEKRLLFAANSDRQNKLFFTFF